MANQSLPELLAQTQAFNKDENFTATYDLLTPEILQQRNNAALYAEAAQACWRLKKYDECENYADKALSIEPDNARANHYKGSIFYNAKNYPKAIEYYEKAIDKDSNYAYPYNGLGNVYVTLKDLP